MPASLLERQCLSVLFQTEHIGWKRKTSANHLAVFEDVELPELSETKTTLSSKNSEA